jgi:hypothetical protein
VLSRRARHDVLDSCDVANSPAPALRSPVIAAGSRHRRQLNKRESGTSDRLPADLIIDAHDHPEPRAK